MHRGGNFLLALVLLMCMAGQPAQTAAGHNNDEPNRIVAMHGGFSVTQPPGWFVEVGAELPLFFNYPPERSLPQSQVPPGGAETYLLNCKSVQREVELVYVSSCAYHQIRAYHAVNVLKRDMPAHTVGAAPAFQESFDDPVLGNFPRQHYVFVFWESRKEVFEAELRHSLGDPNGEEYQRVLLMLLRSIPPD
jgi:hypothetical protein